MENLTDAELLRLLAENNEEAFFTLYSRYFNKIYFAASRFLSPEDAEEVCHEIFQTTWYKRETMPYVESFKAYVTSRTQELVYDRFRLAVAAGRDKHRIQETKNDTTASENSVPLTGKIQPNGA